MWILCTCICGTKVQPALPLDQLAAWVGREGAEDEEGAGKVGGRGGRSNIPLITTPWHGVVVVVVVAQHTVADTCLTFC